MKSKKVRNGSEKNNIEIDLGRMEDEIKGLSERVDLALEGSSEQFKTCPKCGLPTYYGDGGRTAFCARCSESFDVRSKKGKKRLKKKEMTVSTRSKLIIGMVAVGIMILLLSLSFFYFLSEKDLDYIDIHDINEIRELPDAKNIPQRMMSQDELEERISGSVDDEERQRLWELERFFKCMFIIPEDWDLIDLMENESDGSGIAGFYDTETEEMFVIGDLHSSQYVNYILSHEYTHALQDQNFDLDDYMDVNGYDVELARLCAIEGDAVMTMEMWAERNLDNSDMLLIQIESIAQILSTVDYDGSYYNEILGEVSYYPYEGGFDFVAEIHDEGGWDAVNSLFTDKPPLSTEQIMHHDKYIEYEPPLEVEFDDVPEGYTEKFNSVVGEKLFSEIIGYFSGHYYSSYGAASGWGGDRFYYYENGEDFLAVTATRWDSDVDNQNFENDITSVFDDIGTYDAGLYSIRDNYLHYESHSDTTMIYYGSSSEVVQGFMG